MQKLTDQGQLVQDEWELLPKETEFSIEAITRPTLIPFNQLHGRIDEIKSLDTIGIWIDTDTSEQALADVPLDVPVIGVYFPVFSDGRGFSLGRMLREQHGYKGELRAMGHYMPDQLHYLKRCGFNAFMVESDSQIDTMKQSLSDFSDSYQAACDQPLPIFRRRNGGAPTVG